VSSLIWLVRKDWRELIASRSWWIFAVLVGPLVGVTFIGAVQTYAELSGLNGTSVGVGEAFVPLIGVWAPTFSACEIAAAFLFPFVAIRLFAGDRQSGAIKLELQGPSSSLARVAAASIVLLGAWLLAFLAPLAAIGLWLSYGGPVYLPELAAVMLGHLLNAGLGVALAAAAAAITEHPSSAAILTLGVTVGTWIVGFVAAVYGGWWERLAAFTPAAMVAEFQHGLIRLAVVLVAAVLVATGLALAAIWLQIGVPIRLRALQSAALAGVSGTLLALSTFAFASWDLSENRGNSFARVEERALEAIHAPLYIRVHLAAEDPRRVDLERRALTRLRRVLPGLRVEYVATTSVGLFEQTNEHYGEIWYELGGRTLVSRSATVEGVLESVFEVAGITPAGEQADEIFRGHPLAVPPRGAAWVFYAVWPAAVTAGAIMVRRRLL
jgi:hypothetical protein